MKLYKKCDGMIAFDNGSDDAIIGEVVLKVEIFHVNLYKFNSLWIHGF